MTLPTLARFEQLELLLDHLGLARRLHRRGVGLVHPGEAAVAALQPNRHGQRIEDARGGADIAGERLVHLHDPAEVALVAGDVTQHGTARPAAARLSASRWPPARAG